MTIRPRAESDAGPLVAALAETHKSDAYPMMATHVNRGWLYDSSFEAAWVAEVDGQAVGQIAAVRGFGGPEFEQALHCPMAKTLGITRFFIGPGGRGMGAASALLDVVNAYAAQRGLALALDVVSVNTAAIALHERRGFKRIGSQIAEWTDDNGAHPTMYLYVVPVPSPSR